MSKEEIYRDLWIMLKSEITEEFQGATLIVKKKDADVKLECQYTDLKGTHKTIIELLPHATSWVVSAIQELNNILTQKQDPWNRLIFSIMLPDFYTVDY